MSENNQKVYVDSVSIKKKELSFGEILCIGIRVEDMIKFLNQHKNSAGYVNIDVLPRKEIGKHGETHYATLNTWKPKQGETNNTPKTPRARGKNAQQASAPAASQESDQTDF